MRDIERNEKRHISSRNFAVFCSIIASTIGTLITGALSGFAWHIGTYVSIFIGIALLLFMMFACCIAAGRADERSGLK